MPPNFIACGRDQEFLLPPSLLDWVPEDHLVWSILSAVEELDLSAFYADYRADGHGRPAYDPAMMVALLLYAYAKGNRSSRGIERECREDVAYRVICANLVPDHSTIAEFCCRHELALAELFTLVLSLCSKAGLAKVGVIAIDGTKVAANASRVASVSYERVVSEILRGPRRPIGARTSSTATRAATSCPSSCAPATAAARGCARPSAGSRAAREGGAARSAQPPEAAQGGQAAPG